MSNYRPTEQQIKCSIMRGKPMQCKPAQPSFLRCTTLAVNSEVAGSKFTKFLSDVDGSSSVLTCSSALRFSRLLWNASAKNVGGYMPFSPIVSYLQIFIHLFIFRNVTYNIYSKFHNATDRIDRWMYRTYVCP